MPKKPAPTEPVRRMRQPCCKCRDCGNTNTFKNLTQTVFSTETHNVGVATNVMLKVESAHPVTAVMVEFAVVQIGMRSMTRKNWNVGRQVTATTVCTSANHAF